MPDHEPGEHHKPDGLLAMLYTRGLIGQAEVAVTRGLAWLCASAENGNPLGSLIRDAGLEPGENARWFAEVHAPDGTRTDLECWWGNPSRPRVVVEAKLSALLTAHQMGSYVTHLRARLADSGLDGLVVVLAPEHRRNEALGVLAASVPEGGHFRSAVWSYEEVLDALETAIGGFGDLAQLRRLIDACEALDIRPFSSAEVAARTPERHQDMVSVLDAVTGSLFGDGQRILPSGRDEHFAWRRYIEVTPGGTNLAVGIPHQDNADLIASWVWLRVHRDTPHARAAGERLRQWHREEGGVVTDTAGHTWVTLGVPTGRSGAQMTKELADQVGGLVTALREPGPTT